MRAGWRRAVMEIGDHACCWWMLNRLLNELTHGRWTLIERSRGEIRGRRWRERQRANHGHMKTMMQLWQNYTYKLQNKTTASKQNRGTQLWLLVLASLIHQCHCYILPDIFYRSEENIKLSNCRHVKALLHFDYFKLLEYFNHQPQNMWKHFPVFLCCTYLSNTGVGGSFEEPDRHLIDKQCTQDTSFQRPAETFHHSLKRVRVRMFEV